MTETYSGPCELYIGGSWCRAADERRFDVIDPATERKIASVADAGSDDARSAVAAAARALPGWAATKPRERAEILRRAFELLTQESEQFARLMTLENGKSLADARAEATYAAEFFRWYSEEAVRNIGQVSRAPSSGARILVQHKPAGIALLIVPWNFPAAMGTRKIAPALAAGCTVILKPAPETPLTSLAIASLLERAGVPPGVVNVLPSQQARTIAATMLNDTRVRVVSFTGSTATGRALLHAAADGIVNPRMELGGNAPFIVCDDADVPAAVAGAMIAKMRNMGEACTAANRFYVQEGVYEQFAQSFAKAMSELRVGNGFDPDVTVGPVINAGARDRIEILVEDARSRGARVLTGGGRVAGPGFFYQPTVLADVPADARCLAEEIFGPVAPLSTFATEAEVIEKANNTLYGLAAYVYTRDLGRGLRMSEKLDFGMVALNRGLLSDPAAPFGGVKQSGLGREGAHEGMLEFLETQYVSVDW